MTIERGIDRTGVRSELESILVDAAGVAAAILAEAGDATLAELGLESLAVLELQAVMQDRHGVKIPEEALEMSLPEITDLVIGQLADDEPAAVEEGA